MDDWIDAMNEVHRSVDETFKAHGIEIAFPQRDLHVRTLPVSRREATAGPEPDPRPGDGVPSGRVSS
jgi:potassium efflux system protein